MKYTPDDIAEIARLTGWHLGTARPAITPAPPGTELAGWWYDAAGRAMACAFTDALMGETQYTVAQAREDAKKRGAEPKTDDTAECGRGVRGKEEAPGIEPGALKLQAIYCHAFIYNYCVILPSSNNCSSIEGGDTVEEMLTAAEVARRAGVHRSTVGDWVAGGLLPVAQTIGRGKGAQRLFALSAAQPLIDEAKNKVGSTSEAIGGAAS